ncbi:FAD-dependent 5-carboxymethylaminomethyl-2-thiouridine(34) oxidoreductase MnmC [Acinetobacter lwoffii]|uniref:tRNA 5-methylaminomethyl-2-thiouridine biosynthesis bifunctional protein MnmC n=1 Tax=Acinetobacter lwoffii NCTC 5866 = CIP 64.10 = NIPH 512 TaxID=981327 RepID=A0ABN0PWX5_ACILW|nr:MULTISPECIES: FAD-dependent 5-carboxymethylaminomethyl-2-thiouridine(34) oxidoreductase MnmC [Acinetobacter]ENU17958.1 tRNA 5-methylaminomethyl-2-thiouridine biosynthesis mnmC [Acinetobacter sp. CIP A162]ESJ94975.1 tRNA 5-methylaminomethyl-2-thiouridine biosynthesis mnmC [Acinetobacter lwoffii NCTC 5866 = CIP 64.10 = NIPH 512]QXB39445.1 FAD-dependent 5-carboxymethylaminomethyl-2-thiouridine(34) oxidoreductase MnmC [Acinetobacter lwoffii]SUU34975.1 5-methylaminomethyl-2-thiouridine methyltran
MSHAIQTADLDWQLVDGIDVPVSKQFGDVYFSKDNGLLETRHVFLNGNDLSTRLADLKPFEYFCVGETGFGTGLNILALWQLWQQVRPDNHSHLHAISVEKFPLSKADLIRALNAWPELKSLADHLISQYPMPIAGCHRLSFPEERFSLDLWLGDAHDVFPVIEKTAPVNAWFLDGFAPSCNPDMWEENVLNNIVRLSEIGTTFASFSVAGVLKRGLKNHGISISRPRGFKHKREMLKAIWNPAEETESSLIQEITQKKTERDTETNIRPSQIAVIGAGIAGLSTAWAFAQRGHQVTIYDQSAPLSGGSGNPLALLNPKLCPVEQSAEHLMTLAWQHALNHYQKFKAFRPIQVNQLALKNPEQLLGLADEYPEEILAVQDTEDQEVQTEFPSLKLLEAGAVSPHQLREEILLHPHIQYQQTKISHIEAATKPQLFSDEQDLGEFDHVIVCTARETTQFFADYPALKPIRGQVSWVNNQNQPLSQNTAYSYGGYCMQLDAEHLILGASFYPGRDDTEVLAKDHVHNYELIHSVFPEYAQSLASTDTWQGRASVRAQSQDYFPLLGKMKADEEIYSFAGLGSKGFLFAPLCSEILAAQILGEACPVPSSLVKKLSVTRFQKKVKVKKPYFRPQI